jgi:hypothetical protein
VAIKFGDIHIKSSKLVMAVLPRYKRTGKPGWKPVPLAVTTDEEEILSGVKVRMGPGIANVAMAVRPASSVATTL